MTTPQTIFVVDDQESILSSVKSVLADESYRVLTFTSAEDLQNVLKTGSERPDLILLDIWLPGIDGIEAVVELKDSHPRLPVILMSGHAGADIAVKGIMAGAVDFLEKPLNLNILLEKVASHLAGNRRAKIGSLDVPPLVAAALAQGNIASLVLSREPQRTVRRNAVMNGVGLLSGRPTGIIITPAPANSGIVFKTMDGMAIPGHINALENVHHLLDQPETFTANSTVLSKGGRRIRTVEHLLAALHVMGITNASIKVDEEIPNIDGSAADFCRIIAEAGTVEMLERRREIVIHQKIGIGREVLNEKHLYIEPADSFEVTLRVDYPAPIHEQKFHFNPHKQSFLTQIAPARSFNTFENIDAAQQRGMVGSGYLNSHIIIHNGKVINTTLNFPDEFVRHKILDLLGDLYLLGYPIRGRVVGNMTSHGLNQAMALKIHAALTH